LTADCHTRVKVCWLWHASNNCNQYTTCLFYGPHSRRFT